MGIFEKLFGKNKEKKADEAAEKGSRLPGTLGDVSWGWRGFRRTEKEVEKRKE